MPLPQLPNGIVVVRQAMLAQTAITSSAVAERIHFGIPENGTYPLWVLDLVDDIELRPETLFVRVQTNIWGAGNTADDLVDAQDSGALLRSVARDLNGDWPAGKIRACEAPRSLPAADPRTGRVRILVDLEFQLNA